jgi:hypothetical protein
MDGLLTMIRYKRNQCTPLLRLPAELRAAIWDYALGGQIFKLKHSPFAASEWDAKLVPSNAEPMKSMALLRTCRQIYSETASFPLGHGVLEYRDPWLLLSCKSTLGRHQRGYVQRLRIPTPFLDPPGWVESQDWFQKWNWKDMPHWSLLNRTLEDFPKVREVELLFHNVVDVEGDIFQSRVNEVHEWINENSHIHEWGIAFKVRGTSEALGSFQI